MSIRLTGDGCPVVVVLRDVVRFVVMRCVEEVAQRTGSARDFYTRRQRPQGGVDAQWQTVYARARLKCEGSSFTDIVALSSRQSAWRGSGGGNLAAFAVWNQRGCHMQIGCRASTGANATRKPRSKQESDGLLSSARRCTQSLV